jgi:hypothetical protein
VLRGAEKVVEAFGGESPTLKSLGGHPEIHILGETFYTMVPFLYGPYFAKLGVVPVAPELTALIDAPVEVNGKPDSLREAVNAPFAHRGRLGGLAGRPDPYVTVARLEVQPQPAWNEARSREVDDGMVFSPGIAWPRIARWAAS